MRHDRLLRCTVCLIGLLGTIPGMAQTLRITPDQLEGPYYCHNPPRKSDFRVDAQGSNWVSMHLTGQVVNLQGRPMPNAIVDLWHADQNGVYDESCVPHGQPGATYRMRGYTVTDAEGRYEFWTILPGLYPGRTRHLHAKIFDAAAPHTALVTTQLYFPDPYGWDGNFDGVPDISAWRSLVTDGLFNNDFERFGALVMTVANNPQLAGTWEMTFDFVVDAEPPLLGDYDLNGVVNAADLAAWSEQFGQSGGGLNADGNLDGSVDGTDFLIWQRQLGTVEGQGSSHHVPEPNASFLIGIALSSTAGVLGMRGAKAMRTRKSSAAKDEMQRETPAMRNEMLIQANVGEIR